MGVGCCGVGGGCSVWAAGQNARASVRQTRASNARPYYIIERAGVFLREPCLLLVGACTAGPPTGRECIFGFAGAARAGVFGVGCGAKRKSQRSARAGEQCSPLRWNCKRAIKTSRTLSRFMVGVGLCSTRGALRQHKALAGEQCSPLR